MNKKLNKSICIIMVTLILTSLIPIFTLTASADINDYDPVAVAIINGMIDNNNFYGTKNDPANWEFTTWDDSVPKQLINFSSMGNMSSTRLTGAVSFSGLTSLVHLEISENRLTTLDVSGCTALEYLNCANTLTTLTELNLFGCTALKTLACAYNRLTKIDISDCINLRTINCGSNPLVELDLSNLNNLTFLDGNGFWKLLTLTESEEGEYSFAIPLNNPTFGENTAISYENDILKSTDNTIESITFTVETNKPGFTLSGTMYFTYSQLIETIPVEHILSNPDVDVENIQFFEVGSGENATYEIIANFNAILPGTTLYAALYDEHGKLQNVYTERAVQSTTDKLSISNIPSYFFEGNFKIVIWMQNMQPCIKPVTFLTENLNGE